MSIQIFGFLFIFSSLFASCCPKAVSYTHLDVYKRQVHITGNAANELHDEEDIEPAGKEGGNDHGTVSYTNLIQRYYLGRQTEPFFIDRRCCQSLQSKQ